MSTAGPKTSIARPKKFSRGPIRRLPRNIGVFLVNFCRNAQCHLFGVAPDSFQSSRTTQLHKSIPVYGACI